MFGLFQKKETVAPKNNVSLLKVLIAIPLVLTCWYYRIIVFMCMPQLYFFIFSIVKEHLEREALPAEIPIYVYSFADTLFYKLLTVIIVLGITRCVYLWVASKQKMSVIKKAIYHGTMLNLKISLVAGFLYMVPLLLVGKLYVDKLWVLAEKKEYVEVGYNPFKLAFHIAQKMNFLDYIIKNVQKLEQAKILYAHINDLSAFFYVVALMLALLSTIWFFYRLQRKLA